MQAIILAAGMGKRLNELTDNYPKCMIEVDGQPLIYRMLSQLDVLALSRIIIVAGYSGDQLINYVKSLDIRTPIIFLKNNIYFSTNNIYSLYIARKFMTMDDTLLLESDLIFQPLVLQKLVYNKNPNVAVLSKYEAWMDGTVVKLNDDNSIADYSNAQSILEHEENEYLKTVNIYKLDKDYCTNYYVPYLEKYHEAKGTGDYYEQVFKTIPILEETKIYGYCLVEELWYEIDTRQDMENAKKIFKNASLDRIMKRYGGYWEYKDIVDFCYLVNPYFPKDNLLSEMKDNFQQLICSYPSGMNVNCQLAVKYFPLSSDKICIGNGAAELIRVLFKCIDGNVGIQLPTFDEYVRCSGQIAMFQVNGNFTYDEKSIMSFYEHKHIKNLVIINPDNPSGNYIKKSGIIDLAQWTYKRGIRLIIDESFIDFVDAEENATMIDRNILEKYPNIIVIKSISKSYGVPGLRLGIMASGDVDIIKKIKYELPIWNINSFAQFFLQIYEKYNSDHKEAIRKFYKVRHDFYKELSKIPQLRPLSSQANYIMCEVLEKYSSIDLARILLNKYKILIKNLSEKQGVDGRQFIRLAIRTADENRKLIDVLKKMLMGKEENY